MRLELSTSVEFDVAPDLPGEFTGDPDLLAALRDTAESIGSAATVQAPRMIASTIEVLGEDQDSEGDVVYVGSANSFAHLFEYGSVNTQPWAFMRGAASALADRFEPS